MKNRPTLIASYRRGLPWLRARPTVSVLVLTLFMTASLSVAQAKSPAQHGEHDADESAVDVYFAKMIGAALGKKFKTRGLKDGIPFALVELIKARYPQPHNQKPLLTEYRGCAKEFSTRWKGYTERRALVDKATEKAAGLKADKKLAEALKALEAVVTPAAAPPTDHLGRDKPVKREFLEVRDAELPAVTAAAVLITELRLIERLPQVRADFLARRQVSSAQSERLGWLAKHCGKNSRKSQGRFNGFAAGQKNEASRAVTRVLNYSAAAGSNGASIAKGFFKTLSDHGVKFVEVGLKPDLKKGEWVLMALEPTKASKKKISYKKKSRWKESFNCRLSDQINGINPVTGAFTYKLKCETRSKQSLVTLQASLAKGGSSLKKSARGKFDKVWLLGELKKPGPKWQLKNARVVELPEGSSLKFLTPGFR